MPQNALSRRGFLRGASAAAALGVTAHASPSYAADLPPLASAATMRDWNHRVADFGTRLTGTRAEAAYVDWLAAGWERAGLHVRTDRLTFTQWAPRRWALEVEGKPVDVAFYFPYSGETPPGGVIAPLVWLGPSPVDAAAWALAAGKIAVVEVATPPIPVFAAYPETGRYSADMQSPDPLTPIPSISDIAAAPLLSLAKDAGVLGVVCIRTGISDAMAQGQYAPFTTPYQGCPAIWVGPTAGSSLRSQALAGATATLTMDAQVVKGKAVETIWAVLPGSHPSENVVVNSHTDGPNVPEENGGLGLLALARQYAAVPRSHRRRSLVFVAHTGHFQLPQFAIGDGQSASRWMADHPEWIDGRRSRTVAALTLEHLGCREWVDDPVSGRFGPSGRKDVAYTFTTNDRMRSTYLSSCRGTTNDRTITATPAVYTGEGHDFHAAGIATISLIPSMSYLTQTGRNGLVERVDPAYMRGQVATFSKVIRALDRLSTAQIGKPTY